MITIKKSVFRELLKMAYFAGKSDGVIEAAQIVGNLKDAKQVTIDDVINRAEKLISYDSDKSDK